MRQLSNMLQDISNRERRRSYEAFRSSRHRCDAILPKHFFGCSCCPITFVNGALGREASFRVDEAGNFASMHPAVPTQC